MRAAAKPIASFIRRIVMRERAAVADLFSLKHYASRTAQPIEEWRVTYPVAEEWIERTADELHEIATEDAASLKGAQQYVVLALSKEGDLISRKVLDFFSEAAGDPNDVQGVGPGDSIERAMLTQSHRFIEKLMISVTQSQTQVNQALLAENRRLSETIDSAYAKRAEAVTLSESLLDRRQEREMEAIEALAKTEDRREMLKLGKLLLLPAAGKKSPLAAMAGMRALLDSLTEDQRAAIMETLDEKQRISLASLAQATEAPEERSS